MTDSQLRSDSQASKPTAWRVALTTAAEAVTFSVLFAVPVHAALPLFTARSQVRS